MNNCQHVHIESSNSQSVLQRRSFTLAVSTSDILDHLPKMSSLTSRELFVSRYTAADATLELVTTPLSGHSQIDHDGQVERFSRVPRVEAVGALGNPG